MNVLVLYDSNSVYTGTVRDYVEAFDRYSTNRIFYASATFNSRCVFDLDKFDAIIIHYSVRLCYDWHLSFSFAEALSKSSTHKILFIQDEYDNTAMARAWMRRIKINTLFTCVPKEYVELVYPASELPGVEILQTLTGWVPSYLANLREWRPLRDREDWIHYRGRKLPVWYGQLGEEKWQIGEKMRDECHARKIPCDIEWTEDKRIYGPDWTDFVAAGRATLGSESGSNVFDHHGKIRAAVQRAMKKRPASTDEEFYKEFVEAEDGKVKMNQISPRVFEAAALKTGLVLFRGSYSGVVEPDIHYIPLEKDYSNVDEVFERLADLDSLNAMVDRAHEDVIASGKYSYRSFVEGIDRHLESACGNDGKRSSILDIYGTLGVVGTTHSAWLGQSFSDLRYVSKLRWKAFRKNPLGSVKQGLSKVKNGVHRGLNKIGIRRPKWLRKEAHVDPVNQEERK